MATEAQLYKQGYLFMTSFVKTNFFTQILDTFSFRK